MHLVHDDVSELLQGVWVIDKPHQEDSCGHEQDLGSCATTGVHANLVPNKVPNFVIQLLRNSLSNIYGSQPPWLSADNVYVLVINPTIFKKELWNLGSFTAPSVS